jgi:putative membrane protein
MGANNRPAAALLFEQRDPTMPKQSLQRSGEKLAESAEEIKLSTYGVEDSAERTTQLAADRTVFAAERTYAAWVRTGLLAMASGIGAKALLSGLIPEWLIVVTGSVLVLFSAFCFGAAVWRHLEPGVPPPRVDVSRIPPWVLIAVNGFLALVALAAARRHMVWPASWRVKLTKTFAANGAEDTSPLLELVYMMLGQP